MHARDLIDVPLEIDVHTREFEHFLSHRYERNRNVSFFNLDICAHTATYRSGALISFAPFSLAESFHFSRF